MLTTEVKIEKRKNISNITIIKEKNMLNYLIN